MTAVSCSAYAGYQGGEMFKSRLNTKDVKKLVTIPVRISRSKVVQPVDVT